MRDQLDLAVIAVLIGAAVGFVLFVPFVAVSYRRRGGLTFGRFALWAAALVYFWAIWTYTLLPVPDPASVVCVGVNLDIWAFVDDVRGAIARPGTTITDPAVLQLLLNVLLFLPLGAFLRILGGRGIVFALIVGLGLSAFIETTQLTGVWGIYPCAYRVFDVDDMLTNTTGAVLGSVLALVVPRRHRGAPKLATADDPRPVTRGRRMLAMACDLFGSLIVQIGVVVVVQLALEFVVGDRAAVLDGSAAELASTVVVIGIWLGAVLITGRTIGDLAVQLRYHGGPMPAWIARPLRFLGGIGGFVLLGQLPDEWNSVAWLLALAGFVLVLTPVGPRGLPGVVSGQRLVDARAETAAYQDVPGT